MQESIRKTLARGLPGIVTIGLLLAAWLGPAAGVKAGSDPRLEALPGCDLLLQQGSDDGFEITQAGDVVCQPFPTGGTAISCALTIDPATYSSGRMDVVAWDPELLKPRAGVIALRTLSFSVSDLALGRVEMVFDRALVSRDDPGVAEPLGPQLALQYANLGSSSQTVHFQRDGSPEIPEALLFRLGTIMPIEGTHPVTTHRICGGSESIQNSLRVVQSVITSDAAVGDAFVYEIAQRFRVPATTEMRWIEFPVASVPSTASGVVAVYDGAGQSAPPLVFGAALGSAAFGANSTVLWRSCYDFDTPFTLQAEHDYWLVFRTAGKFFLRVRNPTGTEGPGFARIGPSFGRFYDGYSWAQYAQKAVNFRIVGVTPGTIGVGPPTPSRSLLQLSASPNPAPSGTVLSWSGAKGSVRFEAMDARGRRVAEGTIAQGESGRWTWNAAGENGQALPPGLYFVRARDEAGRTASVRVTIVR